jgi:hypothetical protein
VTDSFRKHQVLTDTARTQRKLEELVGTLITRKRSLTMKGVTMSRTLGYCVFGLLLVGCGAKSLKVGSDDSPSSDPTSQCRDASIPIMLPDWPTPNSCVVGSEITSIVGQWEGYFQGLLGEPNTFRLDIMGANSTKGLCGTITFGSHTAPVAYPPPATDPTAVYPPDGFSANVDVMYGNMGPILGLPYTILDGKVDGQRVTFTYNVNEIAKSWCVLQTPYAWDDSCTHFGCLPNGNGTGPGNPAGCTITIGGQTKSYSCAQFMMCDAHPMCDCDATHCVAGGLRVSSFDLVFSGGGVTGLGNGMNVILNRVATPDI